MPKRTGRKMGLAHAAPELSPQSDSTFSERALQIVLGSPPEKQFFVALMTANKQYRRVSNRRTVSEKGHGLLLI